MSEKELSPEELEQAAGGKRKAQSGQGLQDGGSAGAGSGNQVQINDVDELEDPPFDPRP